MKSILLIAGRLILGAIFVVAAYAKLRAPWLEFAGSLNAFEILPEWALEPVSKTLPWCELALGVALISGIWQRWFALIASRTAGVIFCGDGPVVCDRPQNRLRLLRPRGSAGPENAGTRFFHAGARSRSYSRILSCQEPSGTKTRRTSNRLE